MDHSINVCFSTTDSIISRVVRWFTRSEVSHCYITYMDQTLRRVMIMEVHWKGFILVPWDAKTLKGRKLVARYSINVPVEDQLEALHRLTFYLGVGYDYFNLIPMALRRIRAQFQNPFNSEGRIICSESVVHFLNDCGAAKLLHPHSWTPEDLYSYVKKNPDMFVEREVGHD